MRDKSKGKKINYFLKKILCIGLALFMICGIGSPLTTYADTVEKKTIRIGYIDYDGFITEDENGSFSGYGVEYLGKIADYTGWDYEYVYDTWDNQMQNLLTGEIDFICHAQKTEQREADYLFSKYSVGSESSVLYVKTDDERYYYNDFENFDGMRIAVLINSFQNQEVAEYAEKKGFSYTFYEYGTQEECFEALENDTVDGVAMGSLALKSDYKVVCRFGADPFYFISGKQNRELMDELDDALGMISASNATFVLDLYEKYYGQDAESVSDLVFTREESEYIASVGTIDVAFIANRNPFSYVDDAGNPTGITVDIIKLIEERSGLKFNYSMMEAGQKVVDYLQEHPDAIAAGIMTDNPQFQTDEYALSDTFYADDVSLVCRNGFSYDLDAANATYKLAIPVSYAALQEYITSHYPQFELVQASTSGECMKMVLDGEADFMAQNVNVIKPLLQDPHYDGLMLLPTFFMDENMGVVCTNTDEHKILMNIMDKCIAAISEKEKSQFTINHTVTNGYRLTWSDMLYKFRYPMAAIFVLVLILAGVMTLWHVNRKRSYITLEKKNAQLREAVAQADQANHAKSQFLARMSHEIRTPMNAIVGLTAIAMHHNKEPEKINEYLGKIEISSKVLLNIINDVLDMSAIESDKIKIAHNPFNVREVLTSIATIYYTQCKQKDIRFEMNTAEVADEQLIGDGLRLNQILLNLISNAYKFTPPGGKVSIAAKEVSVRQGKAYFNFSVEDTGEGMSKEMQERLFKPFEQESATTAQKHGGSGLGLSIAKNLVEMMEGSISFTSEKGVGTKFTVSIPFEIDEKAVKLDPDRYKTIRALIVDDEVETREYTSVVLNRIGVPYAMAESGTDAMEKLKHAKELGSGFDICFVDWKMPDMNGGVVTKQIRELFSKDTLIIIVSAYDTAEIQEEALKAGADMFLTKPIFQSTVFNLLMKLSGGKYVNQTAENDTYDFEGKKVLLAEDTEFNAEIAIELLGMVNMQVDHAQNGKDAVEMFKEAEAGTYVAVLMDIQMPEMDGYEATRAIRLLEHPQAKTIPIFAMTANAFTEDVSAALNAGMNGHIAKPIDTKILYATLNKVVPKKK